MKIFTQQSAPVLPQSGFFRFKVLSAIAILIGLILLLLGNLWASMNHIPADLDLSRSRSSDQGLYLVAYQPEREPIPTNQLQSWVLTLRDSNGQAIDDAIIRVDGDMPQHGHGLPTQPQVTDYLGNGNYLLEGLKFQMGGWWVLDLTIEQGGQQDTLRFNFILE
jgi:hypothetical protein